MVNIEITIIETILKRLCIFAAFLSEKKNTFTTQIHKMFRLKIMYKYVSSCSSAISRRHWMNKINTVYYSIFKKIIKMKDSFNLIIFVFWLFHAKIEIAIKIWFISQEVWKWNTEHSHRKCGNTEHHSMLFTPIAPCYFIWKRGWILKTMNLY